jgi:hypothetical protein
MNQKKRSCDPKLFIKLAKQGLNCKQIYEKMGHHNNNFGAKMKQVLGMYPSVYIVKVLNAKT